MGANFYQNVYKLEFLNQEALFFTSYKRLRTVDSLLALTLILWANIVGTLKISDLNSGHSWALSQINEHL